jgi:hypothetical protein
VPATINVVEHVDGAAAEALCGAGAAVRHHDAIDVVAVAWGEGALQKNHEKSVAWSIRREVPCQSAPGACDEKRSKLGPSSQAS